MKKELRLLGRAFEACSRGDAFAAIRAFRQLAGRYPRRIDYQVALADLLQDAQLFAPAIQHYEKALGLLAREEAECSPALPDPTRFEPGAILCALGAAQGGSGNLAEAEQCFREAVALRPKARQLVALAELLELTGRRAEALPLLHEALTDDPDHVEAHYRLGCWHMWTDPAEAERALRRVVERDREHGPALAALGLLCSLRGAVEEAETLLDGAIETGRAGALPHVYRGHMASDRGDVETAEAAYRQGLVADPGDPHPYFALGDLHQKQGCPDAARGAYESALRLDPDCADALIRLALLEATEGRYARSRRLLQRGLEIAPEHPWHREIESKLLQHDDPDPAADDSR